MNNNDFIETSNSKGKKLSSTKAKETFKAIRGLTNKYPKDIFLGHLRNKFESIN